MVGRYMHINTRIMWKLAIQPKNETLTPHYMPIDTCMYIHATISAPGMRTLEHNKDSCAKCFQHANQEHMDGWLFAIRMAQYET